MRIFPVWLWITSAMYKLTVAPVVGTFLILAEAITITMIYSLGLSSLNSVTGFNDSFGHILSCRLQRTRQVSHRQFARFYWSWIIWTIPRLTYQMSCTPRPKWGFDCWLNLPAATAMSQRLRGSFLRYRWRIPLMAVFWIWQVLTLWFLHPAIPPVCLGRLHLSYSGQQGGVISARIDMRIRTKQRYHAELFVDSISKLGFEQFANQIHRVYWWHQSKYWRYLCRLKTQRQISCERFALGYTGETQERINARTS